MRPERRRIWSAMTGATPHSEAARGRAAPSLLLVTPGRDLEQLVCESPGCDFALVGSRHVGEALRLSHAMPMPAVMYVPDAYLGVQEGLFELLNALPSDARVLVCLTPNRRLSQDVLRIVAREQRIYLALADSGTLATTALRFVHGHILLSHQAILRALLPDLPVHWCECLIRAVFVAQSQRSVGALARACGLARRTLEYRLAKNRMPAPRVLLAACVVLHVLWAVDVAGFPLKHVSQQWGFSSPTDISAYVRRHTGACVRELVASRGFVGQTAAFVRDLVPQGLAPGRW